jgi:DUF4097 and DUF4098 domain-containing protein YvlB
MAMMKTNRILPVFLGVLLLGTAVGAATLKEAFDRTVPLRPGSQVRLTNVNGAVTFTAWDRNEVRIEAEKQVKTGSAEDARKIMDQVRIEVTQGADGLRIETKLPRRNDGVFDWLFGKQANVNVIYKVHVPRQAALDVESVNGGVTATGTRGKAHLATTNGAIAVTDVQGDLVLETVNGGIDVRRSAGALRAESTNGSIEAELTDLPAGSDLRLGSTNGGIALRLPRDARLSIDAATTNGRVRTDFAVEGGQPGKRSLKGDINGGGGKLYARTTNGSVEINEIR